MVLQQLFLSMKMKIYLRRPDYPRAKESAVVSQTDKSAVELDAIGKVFHSAVRLLCDFHRSQAWER